MPGFHVGLNDISKDSGYSSISKCRDAVQKRATLHGVKAAPG